MCIYCVSAMAPGPFETHAYALQSAFGVSLSQGQQSGVDLQENSLGQSSGCFESSESSARRLRRRHWASTVPWNTGVVFHQSSGITQPQAECSLAQLATSAPDNSSTDRMSVDACNRTVVVPSYMSLDDDQYSRGIYPSCTEYRYCAPLPCLD